MQYKIKKGRHYPQGIRWNILNLTKPYVEFEASFKDDCFYNPMLLPMNDRKDLNKLVGVSSMNGKWSSIIGWRPGSNGKISLYSYFHEGGKFIPNSEVFLGEVGPNETFKGSCQLSWLYGQFPHASISSGGLGIVRMNNTPDKLNTLFIRKCFPYAGGNNPAVQDYTINLKFL